MNQYDLDSGFDSACSNGNLKEIKRYLDLGADINYEDGIGLWVSITNDNIEIVDYLINRGADIYADNHDNLYMALIQDNRKIINLLINKDSGKKWNCYNCIIRSTCNRVCKNFLRRKT